MAKKPQRIVKAAIIDNIGLVQLGVNFVLLFLRRTALENLKKVVLKSVMEFMPGCTSTFGRKFYYAFRFDFSQL